MSVNDLRTSDDGIAFIRKEEEPVWLKAKKDFAGVWSNGIGHALQGNGPFPDITMAQALAQLRGDIRRFEDVINKVVAVRLAQHEFDALVSLVFNIGAGAFAKSTLLRKLNLGQRDQAADQFLVWRMYTDPRDGAKKVSPTLEGRRRRERLVFLGENVVTPPDDAA